MNRSFAITLVAAALALNGAAFAQNINQSQSGNNNNQSISIGNVDGGKPAKKSTKSKKSVQKDDSGNVQSADVSGGSGDVNQNQKGNNNKQSISIGGNTGGKLPTVTQSQQGSGKEQSIAVDGKKVEKSQK